MIDIVADSIEFTILKNKGRTIKIIERQDGFKYKYKVKWLNDSICKINVHARNVEFANGKRNRKIDYMISRNNELCVYNFKDKKIDYCYQNYKKYPESKDFIATTCLSFTWNKKKKIKYIYDTSETEVRIIRIKYCLR